MPLAPPLILTTALILLTSCGQITPEPPLDEDDNPIPLPEPYDDWFVPSTIFPEQGAQRIPLRPTFTVTFNDYPDPKTYLSYTGPSLKTGGINAPGRPTYVFSTKSIYWTPFRDLEPDFEYTWQYSYKGLKSITGAPTYPDPPPLKSLYIADPEAPATPAPPVDLGLVPEPWESIQELFVQKQCYSCHGQAQWMRLNPLTFDSLVGKKAARTDRFLVQPLDPSSSVLLHKLLPDFPLRYGERQPPRWASPSAREYLSVEELWRVERWIGDGAKRQGAKE